MSPRPPVNIRSKVNVIVMVTNCKNVLKTPYQNGSYYTVTELATWVLATRFLLGQKVKGQSHRVTKYCHTLKAIVWPAWVMHSVECSCPALDMWGCCSDWSRVTVNGITLSSALTCWERGQNEHNGAFRRRPGTVRHNTDIYLLTGYGLFVCSFTYLVVFIMQLVLQSSSVKYDKV